MLSNAHIILLQYIYIYFCLEHGHTGHAKRSKKKQLREEAEPVLTTGHSNDSFTATTTTTITTSRRPSLHTPTLTYHSGLAHFFSLQFTTPSSASVAPFLHLLNSSLLFLTSTPLKQANFVLGSSRRHSLDLQKDRLRIIAIPFSAMGVLINEYFA